jgi:hypothetical protein
MVLPGGEVGDVGVGEGIARTGVDDRDGHGRGLSAGGVEHRRWESEERDEAEGGGEGGGGVTRHLSQIYTG